MTHAQRLAADPNASAFVRANAGSGKTKTLIDRTARLLLGGADPAAILCVTYTRAAAAEMQRRLFARLGGWSVLGDEELRNELADLTGEDASLFGASELERRADALRPGAGDARRSEDPDHPRLLRTPAAPISARGGCFAHLRSGRRRLGRRPGAAPRATASPVRCWMKPIP